MQGIACYFVLFVMLSTCAPVIDFLSAQIGIPFGEVEGGKLD